VLEDEEDGDEDDDGDDDTDDDANVDVDVDDDELEAEGPFIRTTLPRLPPRCLGHNVYIDVFVVSEEHDVTCKSPNVILLFEKMY